MSKKKKQSQSKLTDMVFDQSFKFLLSSLLSIALLGGGSYILYEFPAEIHSIEKESLDLSHLAEMISNFNDMGNLTINGWFNDQVEQQRRADIVKQLQKNINQDKLDAVFESSSIDWISKILVRLASERGQISGFYLNDELERKQQQSIVHGYDLEIQSISELENLIINWQFDNRKDRDNRLASLQQLSLESITTLSSLETSLLQLKEQDEFKMKQTQQKFSELDSRIRKIRLNAILSVLGIILGAFILSISISAKLKKQKQ